MLKHFYLLISRYRDALAPGLCEESGSVDVPWEAFAPAIVWFSIFLRISFAQFIVYIFSLIILLMTQIRMCLFFNMYVKLYCVHLETHATLLTVFCFSKVF